MLTVIMILAGVAAFMYVICGMLGAIMQEALHDGPDLPSRAVAVTVPCSVPGAGVALHIVLPDGGELSPWRSVRGPSPSRS